MGVNSQKTRSGKKTVHVSSKRFGVPSKSVKNYPLQYFKSRQRRFVLSRPTLEMSIDDKKGMLGDGFYFFLPDFRKSFRESIDS